MPRFARPLNIPALAQQPQIISGYIAGRAANMAYQNDKARNAMMQQQAQVAKERASAIAFGNTPDQRALATRGAEADIRYKDSLSQPRPVKPVIKAAVDPDTGADIFAAVTPQASVPIPGPGPRASQGVSQTVTVGGEQPTKSRVTKLQETMDVTMNGYHRLKGITAAWKPEYSTLLGRGEQWVKNAADKSGLMDLSPEDKQSLGDYTDWQTKTINNLNDHIRAITGAQLSEHEAKRIMAGMPNLKDGPTQFQAKLKAVMGELSLSHARAKYVIENGYNDSHLQAITLDDMKGIVDQWGMALEQKMLADGVDPKKAHEAAVESVRQRFGL